jgi:hypothetical protein
MRESASYGSYASFDLSNGTLISSANAAPGSIAEVIISAVGNGWFRISALFAGTTAQMIGLWPLSNAYAGGSDTVSYTGTGVDGLYVYGAQVELGALTAYERVDTPTTTYDAVGFPAYLRCDGVDDGMVTGAIDFSGSDKLLSAFAARTAIAGTEQLIWETSAGSGANGTFIINIGAANRFDTFVSPVVLYGASGTVTANAARVFSARIDRAAATAADGINARLDGLASAGSVSGTPAAGNFQAAQQLYLFRRSPGSIPFNGNFYGGILRGGLSDLAAIKAGEVWLASKSGVTLS